MRNEHKSTDCSIHPLFRSKGQASEYENMDSDIPPEEAEQQQPHPMAAAVFKSPSQKPSKIPRLVSSPAKSKPHPTSASKVFIMNLKSFSALL